MSTRAWPLVHAAQRGASSQGGLHGECSLILWTCALGRRESCVVSQEAPVSAPMRRVNSTEFVGGNLYPRK
jgi:hypothetical protein